MKQSSPKIITALAVVLVLSIMFTFPTLTVQASNPGLIDPARTGSITIHKFVSDENGEPGGAHNGTEILDTTGLGTPLAGITFIVTYIPNADVATLVTEAQTYMTENADNLTQYSQATGLDGITVFANLTQGVYLIEEKPNASVTQGITPFLVSIPMTDPSDSSSWLYDIHVYPKNTILQPRITKSVLDANAKPAASITADVGDTVKWLIAPSIPADIASIDLSTNTGYFFISDELDPRLTYESLRIELVDDRNRPVRDFTIGIEYALTVPSTETGGTLTVDFSLPAGIALLKNALWNGYFIHITVSTTINESALVDLSSPITNTAAMYYKNAGGDPLDPVPPIVPTTPPPQVNLSGIALYKWHTDENSSPAALSGATFTIYASQEDALAGNAIQLGAADWTLTTDNNGYIYFSSAQIATLTGRVLAGTESFYLVETTAPAGYELLDTVIEVPLGTTANAVNVKLGPGFSLPITGGAGTALFTVLGLSLMVGTAITFVVLATKKRKKGNA